VLDSVKVRERFGRADLPNMHCNFRPDGEGDKHSIRLEVFITLSVGAKIAVLGVGFFRHDRGLQQPGVRLHY